MFALYTRIRDAKAASGYALPAIAVAAVIGHSRRVDVRAPYRRVRMAGFHRLFVAHKRMAASQFMLDWL
jgi:hypothetical protein